MVLLLKVGPPFTHGDLTGIRGYFLGVGEGVGRREVHYGLRGLSFLERSILRSITTEMGQMAAIRKAPRRPI